jgi:DmsE family decaheme c-type cytochrome
MSWMRWKGLRTPWPLPAFALAWLPLAAGVSPPAAGDYRGDEACAACHEPVAADFAKRNVHARSSEYGKAEAGRTCESCHGPGGRHVDSQDPNDIVNPANVEPGAPADACMSCHGQETARMHWKGGAHASADLSCASCHSMHTPAAPRLLSKSSEEETCVSCHQSLRKTLYSRARHPLREGKMSCSSCHNPHGSASEKMIAAASVNDKCYECHAEKRGPFLWEHFPARESCLNCHAPHGSNHGGMLVTNPTRLCQQCHIQGRHQTNATAPGDVFAFNRACMNCHGAIHGSNSPSGIILQR